MKIIENGLKCPTTISCEDNEPYLITIVNNRDIRRTAMSPKKSVIPSFFPIILAIF